MPIVDAFELRPQEEYLSVNWLEHLGRLDTGEAIQLLRKEKSRVLKLASNGRFATLNVGNTKTAIHERQDRWLRIDHCPFDNDLSHSGIFGYSTDDLEIAAEIALLVSEKDVYPAFC